jgi:hypothetical protein
LWLKSGTHNFWLYIHSSTIEGAMSCLDLLVGLRDDHFEKMELHYPNISSRSRLCPLTSVLLEKILQQNAKRKYSFIYTTFTPDQCRTLATSGTRTDIELERCKFQDDGEAFLEAAAAREDPHTGLAKLTIANCLPFAEGILLLFLRRHKLECLTLILHSLLFGCI